MFDPLNLVIVLACASLLPFFAVVATSFVKLSVVFLLVRNALGVQQIPPNMALNALAIILSAYIMAPVVVQISDALTGGHFDLQSVDGLKAAYLAGSAPLVKFLTAHVGQRERLFFIQTAQVLWPKDVVDRVGTDNLAVLLPAFTLSQLREAFEIGFLLYLPFIAIDLIISNILLAMGMMMVSPLTISLPFKLFLFVMVDGWSRLILGLVKTYAT
jgi:type III secretion protein R